MRRVDHSKANYRAAGGSTRSAFFLWLIWIIWLPYLVPTTVSLFQAHPGPLRLVASMVGLLLFVAIYLRVTWSAARRLTLTVPPPAIGRTSVALCAPLVVLLVLSLTLASIDGWAWGQLFIYTSTAAAIRLPTGQAVQAVVSLILLVIFFGWLTHAATATVVPSVVIVGIPGFVVICLVRSLAASQQLRAVREEMATFAAVTAERLRIARDLHDLLGHNLSLIALKSELAGRLVHVAPERAASEIGDIERVARSALHEVREAVAGYRQPTLASELRGAQEMLTAAGIAYQSGGDDGVAAALPPAIEAVLSWAVREGITNVIRHSRARHCVIRVVREGDDARVEVTDDGPDRIPVESALAASLAPATTTAWQAGNGLRGLSERVEALGGRFEAAARPTGGFRLSVSLPLDERAPGTGVPSTVAAASSGVSSGVSAASASPVASVHVGEASEWGVAQ